MNRFSWERWSEKLSVFLISTIIFTGYLLVTKANATTTWPDTGQNKCYNNFTQITCPLKGQSFFGQDAQYYGPQPSYTKLNASGMPLANTAAIWSMVRDNVTGLIWESKTNTPGIHNRDNAYTWCNSTLESPGICSGVDDTETFIATLNNEKFGGYGDWRIPTIQELSTLLYANGSNPAINTNFFPNTMESGTFPTYSGYWSSTLVAGASAQAWKVDFIGTGLVSHTCRAYSYCKKLVRAVRGVSTVSRPRFVNNHNGTITDSNTGLIWKQSSDFAKSWEDAFRYIANLNQHGFAGYKDWRIPNKNELQSIVDYSMSGPAIDTTFFPDTKNEYYFTSTTEYGANENYWFVYFPTGVVNKWHKGNDGTIRFVRGTSIIKYTLSLILSGTGSGIVKSNPGGISCGNDCSEKYNSGTFVTLTATPFGESNFSGWTGDCTGTGPCVINMNYHKSVQAIFSKPGAGLTPIYLLLKNSVP